MAEDIYIWKRESVYNRQVVSDLLFVKNLHDYALKFALTLYYLVISHILWKAAEFWCFCLLLF